MDLSGVKVRLAPSQNRC